MTFLRRALVFATLWAATALPSVAQATTGTPPFGSFGGGPIDTIDLANLNVHLVIPVLQKAGRGIPFNYNLTYDGSIWTPMTSSGSTTWEPTGSFGWVLPGVGYVQVFSEDVGYGIFAQLINYIDARGTPHSFGASYVLAEVGNCKWYGSPTTPDGSGYTASVAWVTSCVYTITARNGEVVVTSNGQLATDSNGNQVTVNSNGQLFDTLNSTTPALTFAGAGTAASPNTFTYTAPNNQAAAYTMNYTNYTVATNFGVTGITEYKSSAAVPLVTSIVLPDGSQYTFTYESTPSTPASGACIPYTGTTCVTGRLTSVKLPTQGTITYSYSGGNNGILSDGTTATLTRSTPDTGSSAWTYAHTESGTAWTTTITDPSSQQNQTVMNFQGIYATQTQVYQGSAAPANLLKTTYTCYNGSAAPCNSTAITLPITQSTTYVQWPGGLESEINTFYDKETVNGSTSSYGNVTEKDEYSYGAGAPGSLVRKTLVTYASLGNGIVGKPSTVTVEDGSGNVKAQTTYCYDEGTPSGTTTCNATGSPTATSGTPQHVSVTGSRGNATTITYLVSGSATLGRTFTYYDTGNVNVATDVNRAQTTYTYGGCTNSFPTLATEPIGGMTKSTAWNCIGGVTTSITDENNQTVSTAFTDAHFWRPNSQTDQLSNSTSLAYSAGTTLASVESTLNFNGSTSTVDVLATADGLGRPHISQARQVQSSTTYDSVEVDYDSLGRPNRTTLPYSATAGQTNSSAPSIRTAYDALSRPLQITDGGGGTTTYTYSQNDSYVAGGPAPSGENTKRKQLEYDALGRLTSVCEITAGTSLAPAGNCAQSSPQTGYWTEYTYDLNNNLTGVTQNAQSSGKQTRSYTYDDLGRMTSEANPESGTTTYTYDTDSTCGTSEGDLVKKVDAVGNTICYAYDALHRLTSTAYPSGTYAGATPQRHFVYDSATVNGVTMANAKARLAEAYTCFSPCSTKLTDEGFSYTARGEQSDVYESTPHSGGYYHVNETYWANGAPNQLNGGTNPLPGVPTITYGVDGEGRTYSATASSGQNPLSSTTYNMASLPTAVNLGSSDSDSFTYDSNTNRMTQYKFTVNGQSVVGTLNWNPLGTLGSLAITDPFYSANTQTCSYSHDDMTRIASASCGSIWSQTFTYDAFGNIQKNGTNSFQPNYTTSPPTNQYSSIGSCTPSYDADGNILNDCLNTYTWDSNGRPVTADTVSLTYDALDRMVEQNRSGTYAEIAYAPSGGKLALMTGSSLQKGFVPLPGGSIAVYNSTALDHYRHSDWLGSSRLGSTTSQTVLYDVAYGPYGEPYAQSGTPDLSFTGANQDTAPNLYDFPAREYGIQGRWPSPDPAGMASVAPSNPQTWNRYAYALNDPLTVIDPAGLENDPYCSEVECGGGDSSGLPDYYGNSDGLLAGAAGGSNDNQDPNQCQPPLCQTQTTCNDNGCTNVTTDIVPLDYCDPSTDDLCRLYFNQMLNHYQAFGNLLEARYCPIPTLCLAGMMTSAYMRSVYANLVVGAVGSGAGIVGTLGKAAALEIPAATSTRVFWVGQDGLQAALGSGGQLLELSPEAQAALEAGDPSVMQAESAAFAQGATGTVEVFLGNGVGNTFWNYEWPELANNLSNGEIQNIIIHF
ncbi:MAG TPA: RHS repeat-associated core domain-containing protein [Candidatus Acidoferrum sp.]|nr:RHS repeat-associated core domain-containing protein [Candidatus Acidoferrum sp.]